MRITVFLSSVSPCKSSGLSVVFKPLTKHVTGKINPESPQEEVYSGGDPGNNRKKEIKDMLSS